MSSTTAPVSTSAQAQVASPMFQSRISLRAGAQRLRHALALLALGGAALFAADTTPPHLTVQSTASPTPVTGTTTVLSATATDDSGAAGVIFTWAEPANSGNVSFNPNGTSATNGVYASTATFKAAGTYTLQVTIKDAAGNNGLSTDAFRTVTVTVNQTLTSIAVTPASAVVVPSSSSQVFAASGKDQFGATLTSQPGISWSATNGSFPTGTRPSATYTATASAGTYQVTASGGGKSGTASVRVDAAPTLSGISPMTTGPTPVEDTPYVVTLSHLRTAAGAQLVDADDAVSAITFRVESVSPGSSLGIQPAGNPALRQAVTPGTTVVTISPLTELVWTPPANANGQQPAFTVKAYDGYLFSPAAATVAITLAAVNDAPTLTSIAPFTDAVEDTPYVISYAKLQGAAAGLGDVDGGTVNFQVASVAPASGTLQIRTGSTGTLATAAAGTILIANQELVWTPPLNANGPLTPFTVTAYDGSLASTPAVPVSVTVAPVEDAPQWSANPQLSGTEDTPLVISYATLSGYASDPDGEAITSLRVESVISGALGYRDMNQTSTTPIAVQPGMTVIGGSQELVWTPAPDANGTLPAFTVSASDGTLFSAPATVSVVVAAVNDAPTIAVAPYVVGQARAGSQVTLSVLGADDGGEYPALKYTWSTTATSGVTFNPSPAQNTNSAKNTKVTFSSPGSYSFSVLIKDAQGLTCTGSLTVTVGKGVPVITWATPAPVKWNTALTATQLTPTASVPGSFVKTPDVGYIPTTIGVEFLSATFTPQDTATYQSVTVKVPLVVQLAQPLISWPTPAAITCGTALSATQLNATVGGSLAGTWTYSPAAGVKPDVGTTQLQVQFIPTDLAHYQAVIASVNLVVNPGTTQTGGNTTNYGYDFANRLSDRTYSTGVTGDHFEYDADGRLTKAVSGRYANTVQRSYTAHRLTQESLTIDGQTLPIVYGYDNTDKPVSLKYPDNSLVTRDYTARNQVRYVWDGTQAVPQALTVSARTYDNGWRLTKTTYGNGLIETRTYATGDPLVATIKIPSVTSFTYTYDADRRKTDEVDGITTANTQKFIYDNADRVTTWKRTAGLNGTVQSQQAWNLSAVGDWTSTTTDGVVQNRTHTPVHEIATIGSTAILSDFKGNLTQDDQGQQYTWDVENKLLSATNLQQGAGNSATYAYDALGRRVKKVVTTQVSGQGDKVEPTYFISAGEQEVIEIAGSLDAFVTPPTNPEDAGAAPYNPTTGTGANGSLLADPTATRYNFQPPGTDTPDGWKADTGALLTNLATQGHAWTPAQTGVDRDALSRPLYDSFIPLGAGTSTWTMSAANGTHAVVIMCGDATSRAQINHLMVNGVKLIDTTPQPPPAGYEIGAFFGYAVTVTVTNGTITIAGAPDAVNPKINFIEVGPAGSTIDASTTARVAAAATAASHATSVQLPKPALPAQVTRNIWGGTYIDDLSGFTTTKRWQTPKRYYVHNNHLYSVAAVTDSTSQVVSRYKYDAYGVQILTSGVRVTEYGFTGYKVDAESGLDYARARQYSTRLGRFISKDPWQINFSGPSARDGYQDGMSLYGAYFVPGGTDPTGMKYRDPFCVMKTYTFWMDKLTKSGKIPVAWWMWARIRDEIEKACPLADNWYDLPPMKFDGQAGCIRALGVAIMICNRIVGLNERTACLRAAQTLEKACNKMTLGGCGSFPGTSEPYGDDATK